MRRADLSRLVPPWARSAGHALLARPRIGRGAMLVRRSVREFQDDHCPQLAAAISYHLLFSIFPLAIAAVGVLGLITRSSHARDTVANAVLKVAPLSGKGQQQLHELLTSIGGRTGALGLIGLVGVVWAASGVMSAIRTAINVAWDVRRRRSFLLGKAVDLLLLLGTMVMVLAALGVALLTGLARDGSASLPGWLAVLTGPLAAAFAVAATFALLFATFLALFLLLPAVPTRFGDVWIGTAVAAGGVTALQYGFSFYVSNFSNYNRLYGSLGAIVAFMFFVYLASSVFLFGAEVASEYPRLVGRAAHGDQDRHGDQDSGERAEE